MKPFGALTTIELYNILKLREEIFVIEQACIYPDIDGRDEVAHHLMAFDGDTLVGCLRIFGRGVTFEEASIGRLVVSERHRSRGIARALMQQALAFLRTELGETHVKIAAQSYAIPFYESLGFEIVSEEYLEDGIAHVDMVCS